MVVGVLWEYFVWEAPDWQTEGIYFPSSMLLVVAWMVLDPGVGFTV